MGRLRGLSSPLRYLAYIAGALLVLLVAVGVGATAGLVFGGRPEWLTSGSGDTEGTMAAKTGEAATSKGAALETPADAQYANSEEAANPAQNANAPASKTGFTHTTTDANSRGDYTYISDPAIDGDPNAVVLVAESMDRGNAKGASYDHNIGVWYEGANEKKWAIFNQDRAAIPAGRTFEVIIPPASWGTLVHYAKPDNTVENRTYLNNPLTVGEPDALLAVTQNWNPGGGRGVYNDHPIDVLYEADIRKWAIYNADGAPMPDGAAFNIAVSRVRNP
jgi:hypothetical protein